MKIALDLKRKQDADEVTTIPMGAQKKPKVIKVNKETPKTVQPEIARQNSRKEKEGSAWQTVVNKETTRVATKNEAVERKPLAGPNRYSDAGRTQPHATQNQMESE